MQFAVFLLFGIVGLSVQQCNNVNRCCRETARGFDCALKRDPCSCISLCGVADNKIVDIGRATHRIFASEKIIVHQQSSTVFTRMPCQGMFLTIFIQRYHIFYVKKIVTKKRGGGWGLWICNCLQKDSNKNLK